MDVDVKRPMTRRAEKALATRDRILDAAESLFCTDGYAQTTIQAVAEHADVAVQTVYAVFGNKRTILSELLAARVVGDDGDAPLSARTPWREMEGETDPRRQLAMLADLAADIGRRMGPLYDVLAAAAGSDPEIAELHRAQQRKRYADQRRVVRALEQHGSLRPGLTPSQATDILWTIANPTTHQRLVTDRRWSEQDYRQWLADVLVSSLLDPAR